VANVCLEHAWHRVLGDAGALGDPFDALLYRARTNERFWQAGLAEYDAFNGIDWR
jgi:hypothetical protein